MKKLNHKMLLCALAVASSSLWGMNVASADVVAPDNSIVPEQNVVDTDVRGKVESQMQNIATTAQEVKAPAVSKPASAEAITKYVDQEAIASMNKWKEARPSEEAIENTKAYEGKTIVSVDVVGLKGIPESMVLDFIHAKAGDKFNAKTIEEDRNALYNTGYFYDNYPTYKVVPEGVKITYHLLENPILHSVTVEGNTVFTSKQIENSLGIKPGQIINLKELNDNLATIENAYHDAGYILARLGSMGLDESGNLVLVFDEGHLVGYKVKGNDKTKTKVILREMRMKPGAVFNSNLARRSMQRIYNLGFFEDVQVRLVPVKENSNDVIMELTVIERRTGTFGIGAGYSNQDGLLGNISISDTNFRGMGDTIKSNYEFGGKDGKNKGFSFSYIRPWLDSKETTGSFTYYNRKFEYTDYNNDGAGIETYDKRTKGIEINFGRPQDEYTTNFVGFRIGDTKYLDHVSGLNRKKEFPTWVAKNFGTTRAITASHVHDTRDNIYYPTEGVRTSYSLEYAGLGGDFNYKKFTANWQKYYPVGHAQVVAVRANAGIALGDIPDSAMFDVGGQNSIRGYRDGQFTGKRMVMGTVEYRFPIVKKVQGALFADIGDAWSGPQYPWNTIEAKMSLHHSVGVGLQMETPIGPLRIDYGWGSDGGRAHFNIGSSF